MVRDPELIKEITVKDFESFTDHPELIPAEADPLWAKNLFSLTGKSLFYVQNLKNFDVKISWFLPSSASARDLKISVDFKVQNGERCAPTSAPRSPAARYESCSHR